MNQTSMGQKPSAAPKWLWVTLIIVVLVGAGFFGWYYLMGPGKKVASSITTTTTTPATTTTSPSTTSETPSASTNTATTTTTTATPPTGWHAVNDTVTLGRAVSGSIKYQLFLRPHWTSYDSGDPEYPKSSISYGLYPVSGIPTCMVGNSCLFSVYITNVKPSGPYITGTQSSSISNPKTIYAGLSFGTGVNDSEKQIITDSFKAVK